MKNKINILALFSYLSLSMLVVSCNDSSMDRYPLDTQTEATVFTTYDNFKTYAWSFYSAFTDTGNFGRAMNSYYGYYSNDELAGYLSKVGTTASQNIYAAQTATVPSTGGGWDFEQIRAINIMISNIDGSSMTQDEKDHWRAVGLFFHSFCYVEQIMRFGDVVWLDEPISDSEATDPIARTSREEAADKVMENLQWAEENINSVFGNDVDGANSIDVDAIRALICRFGLWEGTWRKYHNSGGSSDSYFSECKRTAELLMQQFPEVDDSYDNRYNSEDLSTYKGSILYKEYVQPNLRHWNTGIERSSSNIYQTHKFIIEMFLTQDGLPIFNANNTDYEGDNTMYDEFRNRDYRLLLNIVPPYVIIGGGNYGAGNWEYTDDVSDREYIDYMAANSPANRKQLPLMNGAAPSEGTIAAVTPHFKGQDGQAFCVSTSGYYTWKSYNLEDECPGATQSFDRPIFSIEEVLLNYAEVMYYLGSFNQSIAEITINKLRPRAKVANMDVAAINDSFDPNRDPDIDPVLWEIRRERLVELFGEGFGFYDIRRWKVAPWFINKKQVGCYVRRTDLGGLSESVVTIDGGGSEGYVYLFPDPVEAGTGWKDTYYLYPIPYQELGLNESLNQNPGWELE